MASQYQVQQYLAYWFQLGKRVVIQHSHEALQPQPVIQGDRYSSDFEACWKRIIDPRTGDCYLEGTDQTIRELLSGAWEILPCGRCSMPVPMAAQGLPALSCPCSDLPGWPNTDIPQPRSPISTEHQLIQIRERLAKSDQRAAKRASDESQAS